MNKTFHFHKGNYVTEGYLKTSFSFKCSHQSLLDGIMHYTKMTKWFRKCVKDKSWLVSESLHITSFKSKYQSNLTNRHSSSFPLLVYSISILSFILKLSEAHHKIMLFSTYSTLKGHPSFQKYIKNFSHGPNLKRRELLVYILKSALAILYPTPSIR